MGSRDAEQVLWGAMEQGRSAEQMVSKNSATEQTANKPNGCSPPPLACHKMG